MGTDVHAVWQVKRNKGWVDVTADSRWEQNRHYFLFSWLADVRNGYGVAGVPTYTPIQPIAEPRGLPPDITVDDHGYYAPEQWLGDHSHTWLSADEILAAERPDVDGGTIQTGVVTIEQWRAWDRKSPPEGEWCNGISGPGILVAEHPSEVTAATTHVRIAWSMPPVLDYFIDEVRRMRDIHGPSLRLVLGFDS